jgi:uncharacterized protein YndB with AHSA1/START domain
MPEHAVGLHREGRYVLRFERLLAHSRERVWRALTEHQELAAWHPTPLCWRERASCSCPRPALRRWAPAACWHSRCPR